MILFARYIWPPLLAWNVYLHRVGQKNKEAVAEMRLHIAENYSGKRDLEKMFGDFEQRIDRRIDQLVKTLCATK